MKKLAFVFLISVSFLLFDSCSIFQEQQPQVRYVSAANYISKNYKGKSRSYIIQNFPYSITDIKNLGDGYEILISERYRALTGTAYTYFYLKDGVCYKIETNEYMAAPN